MDTSLGASAVVEVQLLLRLLGGADVGKR